MDPEEDFLTWSVILSTSFESGEYTSLLPSFTGLVTDIISNSKLHGILEEHTDYFLGTVLPETIRSVLSLGFLSTYDRDACTTFLITVLPLISWSAIHDNFTLSQNLLQILDIKANMYTKNSVYNQCVPYEEVAKNYINQNMCAELITFIKENCPAKTEKKIQNDENDNDTNIEEENKTKSQGTENEQSTQGTTPENINKLTINHFDVLFYGYDLIEESNFIIIEDISNIVEVIPYFVQFIESFQFDDRLRELDTTLLNRSFQSLMVVLVGYPTQPFEAHAFHPLFELANNFLQSEMLEKQLVGAAVLSKAAESRDSQIKSVFQDWANTTTLADFLISKDIHAKLLEALDPVLSKIITPKHLESFWEKAEQAHSTERSTMLSIIASTLKKFDEEVTLNFIDRITSADSISPELLEFLATVSKSFSSVNIDLSLHIINTLIDYGEKLPDDVIPNGAVTALAIFAPYDTKPKCQKQIISVCSERLITNPSKQKFYIQVLKNMVSSTYQSRNDFNKEFLTLLINAISNPEFEQYQNRAELYELLSLLVTKKKYSIDTEFFNTLVSYRVDDLFWKFLTEIITKLGTDAFDAGVREKVRETAKQIDFKNNSSLTFVQFLTQFILIWNLKSGNVKSEYAHNYYYHYETKTIPNPYVLSIFPLERIGLLFKVLIFTKDEYVASEAESKFLLFIEKTKNSSTNKVMKTLYDYFNKVPTLIEKSKQIKNSNENKNKDQNKDENKDPKETSENDNDNKDVKEETNENDNDNKDVKEETNVEVNPNEIDAETENAEYIAKARILKLILQYIDNVEKDYYIEDYGVSRHKERSEVLKKRRPNYDEIKLNIVFDSRKFTLTTTSMSTPEELKKRISRRFETSNLTLYHNNIPISSYATLYSASVKNGSTITCRQYGANYEQKTGKKMPTIILYENNFSKPMLEILSKSSPINNNEECAASLDNLQKIVYTILKRLPSDQEIVNELDNMDTFVKNLSDSLSNTRLFLYRLQILQERLVKDSDISSAIIDTGGANLLFDYLLNHEAPFHGLTLILKTLIIILKNTLTSLLSPDSEFSMSGYDEKLIYYALNLFSLVEKRPEIKKSFTAAIDFLTDFLINNRKRTSEIIYQHQDLLGKMIDNIDNTDKDVYIPFIKFIQSLDDKVQLFHLCVSMLNQNISQGSNENNVSIDPNIIYIIQNTIPWVHNLEDIKIVLDNCWKMIAKYKSTLNIISYSPMDQILPVPLGYDDNNESSNKDNKLIYATHSSGNQTAQLSGVCQIIYSILTQEYQLEEEEKQNIPHIIDLLRLAITTDNDEVQEQLFKLFGLLMPKEADKEQYDLVIQNLRNAISDISTDRWNYKPSTFAKSATEFTGLRNLGSTCYMNSIFQQLFFTFPFTYLIILSDMKSPLPPPPNQNGNQNTDKNKNVQNEGHQKLKELFTQLLLTKRRCCDTQPFCSTWKGWGKRLINPREQQDANEFLQLLLDQLPPQLNYPFKGEIKNVIEGESEDFYSFNIEQFYTICLEIKGYKNVKESFEFFIKSEPLRGESQYSISQDHKIDAKKYEMIKTAPDVLVLQLKRFEYNLQSFERVKVNDRYEFPDELNISEYMAPENEPSNSINSATNSYDISHNDSVSNDDIASKSASVENVANNSSKYDYKLAGVVVHSGNAEGGHYYSIIKIDQRWVKFNDIEVTEVTQEEFETETYGGQTANKSNSVYNDAYEESTGASAYLLFYRRVNAVYETDLPISLFKQCFETQEPTKEASEAATPDTQEETKIEAQEEAKTETQEETKIEAQEENKTDESGKTVHVRLRYDKPFDLTYLCDRNIIKSIEEDNSELVKLQSIFSLPTFNFVVNSHNVKDLESLVSYFFHIFCHSSFSSQATMMQYHMDNTIHTEEEWSFCINYIFDNFKQLIEPIYINCSINEIMECTSQFIICVIANNPPEKSFPFVEELLRTLVYVLNSSWRQVPYVSELMKSFVIQGKEHVDMALANNWINKFLDFITLVYDPTQQNELVSLLSPSATPASSTPSLSSLTKQSSSTLSYATGNGSSSNLVQQITRSSVILQNINLSNVFLILDALFDACPSKDYEKIVKYSSSILQSPSHSQFYINLLKKMSEKDVIDINILVNSITANKKEIDNDLVFDVVLNVLLNTDDPDRIESLISKVCPSVNAALSPNSSTNSIYAANNVSLSLTTAFTKRISNLVKQRNIQVIDFLLKYPRQTIFRFLIDNDQKARSYAEKIVMNIFNKVSKVSDVDREKIISSHNTQQANSGNAQHINNNDKTVVTKSDSSDDNNIVCNVEEFHVKDERKAELTQEDREKMTNLYKEMTSFIFDFVEEDISKYYEKENENYSSIDSYHFINFLNVFEWLIVRLNLLLSDEPFSAVQMLFSAFAEKKNKIDYNMITCLGIINLFSLETQQSVFEDNYNAIFVKWEKISKYDFNNLFKMFIDYLYYFCRPCDAFVFFKHPVMKTIHEVLFEDNLQFNAIVFRLYNTLVAKFMNDDNHIIEKNGQQVHEEFSLKQIIYMDTKALFTPEISSISAFWTPQYTQLISLCYKYMNIPMRKKLIKECANTLNLPRKIYRNYLYQADNSKKFIEACNIILLTRSTSDNLKYQKVEVQKDMYSELILNKQKVATENDFQSNFDEDAPDPYENDQNRTETNRNYNIINNRSYIVNQPFNDYDDLDNYDEDNSQTGTYLSLQVSGNNNENINDENNPDVFEKVFIKWKRFINNYFSVEEENQLFTCAQVFSMISKSEMKEFIKNKEKLKVKLDEIRTTIQNQNENIEKLRIQRQQERFEKQQRKLQRRQQQQQQSLIDYGLIEEEEEDIEFDEDDQLSNILIRNQHQERQLERAFENLKEDQTCSFLTFNELQQTLNQSAEDDQVSRIGILMTDLVFIIMDFRILCNQKFEDLNELSIEEEIKSKAQNIVKLNNLFQNKNNQALSLFFYRSLWMHLIKSKITDSNVINENLDDVDNWSNFFVTKTIYNFSYNRFSFLLYSKVINQMDDANVVKLFQSFCQNTRFSETFYTNQIHYNRGRFYDDSSSDDDFGQNSIQYQATGECRPIEEAFNQAAIFFKTKPGLRSTFISIFPFKFSQITNQSEYINKSFIKEVYGDYPPGFEANVANYDNDDENNSNNNNVVTNEKSFSYDIEEEEEENNRNNRNNNIIHEKSDSLDFNDNSVNNRMLNQHIKNIVEDDDNPFNQYANNEYEDYSHLFKKDENDVIDQYVDDDKLNDYLKKITQNYDNENDNNENNKIEYPFSTSDSTDIDKGKDNNTIDYYVIGHSNTHTNNGNEADDEDDSHPDDNDDEDDTNDNHERIRGNLL